MTWNGSQILMPQIAAGGAQPPPPSVGDEKLWDLEQLVPINLIREHTKTDDVPSVSDEQLAMYRQAALEAAEQYTGLLLAGSRPITEPIECQWSRSALKKMSFKHRTQYPVSDGLVYLYGQGGSRTLQVRKGSRDVQIPILMVSPDLSSACCRTGCNPANEFNRGMHILYRAGFDCDAKNGGLPAGIILGMLKYIAWNITHPGDELYTARNRISNNQGGLMLGTNNVAWASGALELWRQYDPDAL